MDDGLVKDELVFYEEVENESIGDIEIVNWFSEAGCCFLIDDVIFVNEEETGRICIFRFNDKEDLQKALKMKGSTFFGQIFRMKPADETLKEYIPRNWFDLPSNVSNFGSNEEYLLKRVKEFRFFLNSYDKSSSNCMIGKIPKSGVSKSKYFYVKNKDEQIQSFISLPIVPIVENSDHAPVRICVISDTHSLHHHLQFDGLEGIDILIHCGDFTDKTTGIWKSFDKETPPFQVVNFNEFMGSKKLAKIKKKIVISGNHDIGFLDSNKGSYSHESRERFLSNCIFLNNSSFIYPLHYDESNGKKKDIDVSIKIHCVAFNSKGESRENVMKNIEEIPEDTNILIFHFPPIYGNNIDMFLKTQCLRNLKVVCFGHLHYRHFVKRIGKVTYIAAPSFNSMNFEINPMICFNYYV